jgi:nuclear protein localization family protein 4
MRVGFLYGYYAEDPNFLEGIRAVVEFIYEPPQECHFNEF